MKEFGTIMFGHDRVGTLPDEATMAAWLAYIKGHPFI